MTECISCSTEPEEIPNFACSLWLPDGTIVEQVQGYHYCVRSPDGTFSLPEEYVYKDKHYKPFWDDLIKKEIIKLPEKPVEYGTTLDLFNAICAFAHRYVDVPPEYEKIFALNAMYSWVYDSIGTVAYSRGLGDTGTGKTRLLDVFGNISYRPCFASGAIGSAPVFRIIEKYHPTLIVDESDFSDSGAKADIVKVFNTGYQQGKPILRCNPKDFNNIEAFDAFCPKMFATRKQFKDVALESRCFTVVMEESERSDIPHNLLTEFYEEALELRNKLLMFRFSNLNTISLMHINNGIEQRIAQICEPLMSISTETQPYVLEFAKLHSKNMKSQRSHTVEYEILSVLKKIFTNSNCLERKVTASELEDETDFHKSHIGRVLSGLGIIQEKDNTKRYYSCETNKNKLARLYTKYDLN